MPSEFDIIQRYFNWHNSKAQSKGLVKGIGDDAAVLQIPSNRQLVVTTDTLVSGIHFPEQTSPHAVGYKALAVNLSDLAAMGADPAWFTLALTLPAKDILWLEGFSSGLKTLAEEAKILLIGGDTTKGALSISITAMGLAVANNLMLRSTAKDKDIIYVTHTLGGAAAGLAMVQERFEGDDDNRCVQQLNYPTPRYSESQAIRGFASACLDISDGFLADLNHILESSSMGAIIDIQSIPLPESLKKINPSIALRYALTGGDDYELLFTIPANKQLAFEQKIQQENIRCTAVGTIEATVSGIITTQNRVLNPSGYDHFN